MILVDTVIRFAILGLLINNPININYLKIEADNLINQFSFSPKNSENHYQVNNINDIIIKDFVKQLNEIEIKSIFLEDKRLVQPLYENVIKRSFKIKNHFLQYYQLRLKGIRIYYIQNSLTKNIISLPLEDYHILKVDNNFPKIIEKDLLQILKGIFVSINNIKEAELFVKTLLIINYGVDLKLYESYETYSLSKVLQKIVSSVLNLDNDNKIPDEDSMILEKLRLKQMKNYYLIEYRLSKRNPDSTKKDLVIYCKEKLLRDASLLSIKYSIKGKILIE